jgi:radical SAM protein with 4Fe4S-binding SPASM domain
MTKSHNGAADLLAARAARSRAPTAATLQVTNRCNYECSHCYQVHDDHADELSFEEIERILREFADAGVLFLVLMGGEFFMRRDADRILALGHELGFALRLKTTGHHVTDKRADFLATVRPLEVDLSVYAAGRHAHEEVTRHPGSFERTLAAARRLIERRIPVVLRCPVMQGNVGEIEALRQLARDLGAQVSFDPKIVAREDASLEPTTLRMDAEALRTFYRDAMGDTIAGQYVGFDACSGRKEGVEINAREASPCGAGARAVSVDPQGKVWPCNVLPVPSGDLRRQSFREIWYGSPQLEEVRAVRWAHLHECNACALRPYCQRCHAMALIEHGEMYGPSLEACRHAVATRDALRDRGVIPATETQLPPTWDRIDPDGRHDRLDADRHRRRPPGLRVLT